MSSYTITKKNKLEEVKNIIIEAVPGSSPMYPNYKYHMRIPSGQDLDGSANIHSLSNVNIRTEATIKGPILPHSSLRKMGKDSGAAADLGPKKPCAEMRIADDDTSKFASIHDYLDISHRLAWIALRCGFGSSFPNGLALTYRDITYDTIGELGDSKTESGYLVCIVLKDGSVKPLTEYAKTNANEKVSDFLKALKTSEYCGMCQIAPNVHSHIINTKQIPSRLFSTKKAGNDAAKDQYTVMGEFYMPKGVKQRSTSDNATPMSPLMMTPEYWGINIPLVTEVNGQRRIATIDGKRLNWVDLEKIRNSCPDLPNEIAKHQNCVVVKDSNTVGGFFIGEMVYHISGVMASTNGTKPKTHYTIETLCKLPGEATVGQTADLYDSYEVKTAPTNRFRFEPMSAAPQENSLIGEAEED